MEIIKKRDNIQELFKGFYQIYLGITSENPFTSSEIREYTSVWLALFLQTFPLIVIYEKSAQKSTPYRCTRVNQQ